MDKGKLDNIFSATTEAIIIHDAEGSILYANTPARQMLGDISENTQIFGFLEPAGQAAIRQFIRQAPASMGAFLQQEMLFMNQQQHFLPLSLVMNAIRQGGQLLFMMVLEQADFKLEQVENIYQLMADGLPGVLSLYDNKLHCLYANAGSRRLYAYSPYEYTRQGGMLGLISNAEKEGFLQQLREDSYRRLPYAVYFYQALSKEGKILRIRNTVRRIYKPDGEFYRLIAYEETVDAETFAREEQEQLFPEEAMLLLDAGWQISYASEGARHLLRDNHPEGKPLSALLPAEVRPKLEKEQKLIPPKQAGSTRQLFSLGSGPNRQAYLLTFNRFSDDEGQLLYILLHLSRQPAGTTSPEQVLTEQLMPYLNDSYALVEVGSGMVQQFNDHFSSKLQTTQEGEATFPLYRLFAEADAADAFYQALRDEKLSQYSADARLMNKAGQPARANVALSKLSVAEKPLALLRVFLYPESPENPDLFTEYRRNEMTVLGREIKTPLDKILGMVDLLLEKNSDDEQQKLLLSLRESGENIMDLLDSYADDTDARGDASRQLIDFSLRALVQELKQTYRGLAGEKGLIFRTLMEDELPDAVRGDQRRLNQVLQTLLSNALRFTEQGQVVLSVYAEDARKTAHRLLFEVSDTGSGISEDLQEKIFRTRPAEEPSRKPDGSGPGLPVVRELVKRMGGSISLKSRPGEGTVFRVSLPFAAAGDAESPQSQSNRSFIHQFQPLDGLKVLYVEDVIPNQFLMEGLCDTWNVELDTALNGLEALEKVKNNRYDLILMDIQMPEMDGYQTAGEIRKLQDAHYRNVPIFALSGSVSEKTQSKIRETGMDDYIAKPINPYDLHHKLSTVYLSEQEMATIRLSPRVASPEASKTPEADQPGFAEIRTLYANDPAGYVKILQQILKLTEESAATIEITLKRGDEPKFRSSAHKIMSYIRLLQLQQLQTLLKNIKDNFEAVAASPEATIKKLRAHFNYLIEQLKLETQQYSS